MTARTLSHYEILEEINRGGMGVVFRARDNKLGREVAIKLLSPERLERPDRRARFVREAKAAALIEHPRIATIYEIGEHEGRTFIVMELVDGPSLASILHGVDGRAEKHEPPRRLVEIALQITEGLAVAHDKGVVHRDLKPSNVMLTAKGDVKIVDFGIAKLLESPSGEGHDSLLGRARTDSGELLGTVSYMSPEQARGGKIDHRSDIFSFGVMLYQMLSGRLPFAGDSAADTLSAILRDPPAPLGSLEVSGADRKTLQRVLDRCLAKNPGERYSDFREVQADLREVLDRSGVSRRPRFGRTRKLGAALALVVALGTFYFAFTTRRSGIVGLANPVQLTAAVGVEDFPAWSSDGNTLAYHSNQSGNWDIWVTQVGGGQSLNRTADYAGDDQFPSWSPDGRRIAFWSSRERGGIFVMHALAGPPRKLADAEPLGPPQWSADGSRLGYCTVRDSRGVFEILSLGSGGVERSSPLGELGCRSVAWSPDERFAAFLDTFSYQSTYHALSLLRLEDGAIIELTGGENIFRPTWARDARALYYVSNRGGSYELWTQAITRDGRPDGEPRALTTGLGVRSASFSPDGSRLAYSKGRKVANVWRVPVLADRAARWADAEQITFEQAYVEFVALSPDGNRLVVSSDRNGNEDLWLLPASGGDFLQLTSHAAPDWAPAFSPDGREVVFYSARAGDRDIWVTPVSGGIPRQLTGPPADENQPAWSPDGREIVFDSSREGSRNLWILPSQGGDERPFTEHPASDSTPSWSPDGGWIVFRSTRSGGGRLWRKSTRDGEQQQLTTAPALAKSIWAPDGQTVYFVSGTDSPAGGNLGRDIWSVDLRSGAERPVTALEGRRGTLGIYALATDGRWIYFSWEEELGDIWVMDVSEN